MSSPLTTLQATKAIERVIRERARAQGAMGGSKATNRYKFTPEAARAAVQARWRNARLERSQAIAKDAARRAGGLGKRKLP